MNATTGLQTFFEWLLRRSWQAGVLVLCVMLLQWLFRRQLTNRWRFALWWIVLARLVLPFGPESELSLFNCFRSPPAAGLVSGNDPAAASTVAIGDTSFEPATMPASSQIMQPPSTPEDIGLVAPPQAGGDSASTIPARHKGRQHKPGTSFREFILPSAIGVWLAVAGALAAGMLLQVFKFRRRLARSAAEPDARLREILAGCRRELRVTRKIQLLETDAVKSPALFGLFHLRLLLPHGLTAKFDREELRFIFLHELAHVRRGDLWLNWLVTSLQILHWFNPLLWLAFERLRADRELACDELALQHTGETTAEAYGSTIIKLLEGLQRPTAMPGLVGILEDRHQMRRRIARITGFKRATRWSALAGLLVAALGLVALTDAQPEATVANRPDLTGMVETKSGQPVQATVFIDTAGPKVGTSSFCPSCYADCAKSAKADAEGKFVIKSLDPQLIFQILAVAPGYKPKFVSKVDPAKGPVKIQLEPIEMAAAPPGNCLHGQVVDSDGKPIVGAVVEAHGIRTYNGGGLWGALPGVDPLAVTDDKGDFLITSLKPFDMMDVRVSARGNANKTFTKLASGNEPHKLVLTEGASITGRVLFRGKPLTNVEVGVVSVDRGTENFTGNFDVGTDANGRFLLVNLPPNVDYFIYGLMKRLEPYGAIPAQVVHAGEDGGVTDVGDLVVRPGHRLAGLVVLADGDPLPPNTRLLISREKAWDSIQVNLPPDGRFDVTNVPTETYTLSVRVPGYRVSAKNGSFDTLNPFRLVGRVDEDMTNLTFLLEKGKNLASQEYDSPESDWPQNRPLEGVGAQAQPDRSQDWAVSGRVTDRQTGEPVQQFRVTPGEENLTWGRISWDQHDATDATNGAYTVYVDKRWAQPALKVEADGYLPASATVTPLEQTNADFVLHKGTGPSGVVLQPDGVPATNADVLLVCADSQQQPNLGYNGHLNSWPRQDLVIKTDGKGHFAFTPRLGMQSVAAASPAGFAQVPVSSLATKPVITLKAYGEIKGVLERPGGPGTNETLDLAFVAPPGSTNQSISLNNSAHTDAGGRFEFKRVPPGNLEITYRVPVSENGWQNSSLQRVSLKPGQTLEVSIKAPARQPSRESIGSGPPPPVRVPGVEIKGSVVAPSGEPVANAQVGLQVRGQFVQLGRAALISYQGWQDGLIVRTGPDGKFALPMCQGAETVIAVSEDGFARVTIDALKHSSQIKLQPWGRIEGTLRLGRHWGTNQIIMLYDWHPMMDTNSPEPLNYGDNDYKARTDNEGRFVLTFVPPGEHILARMVPEGNRSWTSDRLGVVDIKAGETKQVELGANGRTVIGKVRVIGTNAPPDWHQGQLQLQTYSKLLEQFQQARTQDQRMEIMRSPSYQKEAMNIHDYPATLSPDGSFKAEDVVPGKYDLNIQLFKPGPMAFPPAQITYLKSTREVNVPEAVGSNDARVDVGTIDLATFTVKIPINARTNADGTTGR
jgi:beta-lactamase regulating signal transducer with metallopeptidase domain/uncharacterized GH25 family protein